jgi:hypothetical protein
MVSTHQKLLLDTDAEKAKRKDSLDRRVMRAKFSREFNGS